MDLDLKYPALSDLRRKARRRIPKFAFEYLDSATGRELGAARNRTALDAILFRPDILKGHLDPDLETEFMGRRWSLPVGIAPVGMAGVIWPGAERLLASAAVRHGIPYAQSTVATQDPEGVADVIGDNGWFQHYPVKDLDIMVDMLRRIGDVGFQKLVMTVDVPGESRRERQRRAMISVPPRITPGIALSMALHPRWCLETLRNGTPRLKFPESYGNDRGHENAFVHAGRVIRGFPDWDYLRAVRAAWDGDFIVKGVADGDTARRLVAEGVDGIWVSNHSARQFEGGPAAIDTLPQVRAALGPDVPVIYDSGVTGGLDVLRALALGADFVFLGRAFYYAVAAMGARGIDHWVHVLRADMVSNMTQIGTTSLDELADRLLSG